MTAATGTTGTEAAGATTDGATATSGSTATGEQQQAAAATATQATGQEVKDLPEWAQKIVTDARKEAGDHRVAAKTAAENAEKALADKLAVALGLKSDADPAKLTEQLTAQTQAARDSQVQLAVYRSAGAAGANPDALLDSASFLAKVRTLDPAAADFSTQVGAAITEAVAANQSLKVARAAGASGIEQTGGTGEQGQITEEQLKNMTPEQIVEAHKKGLLNHLL